MSANSIQYTKEQNPWYSFRPYEEGDVDKFKGRGKDIAEVMKYVMGNDFVVCYAKSGIGKSSLINAGLMPRLRKKQILPILIKFTEDFFSADSFERNIRNQIFSEINKLNDKAKEEEREDTYSFLRHPSIEGSPVMKAADAELADSSIWWWLSTYQLTCQRGEFDIIYQPILIFDQFEELFQKTQTDEQRMAFFKWLQQMSLARPSDDMQAKLQHVQELYPDTSVSLPIECGWKILLSLREDYIGLLDYWCIQRIRIPEVQNNRYCLMPLTIEQAEEVVTQQTIDGRRVDILDKYKQTIIDSLIEADGIPAVLLSVLCNRIFDEEISGYTSTAHKLNYLAASSENDGDNEQLKKVIRALIRSVYEGRVKEAKVSKRLVNKVEHALVRDNGTRRRPELSELSKRQQDACMQLANVYLVRIDDFGEKKGEKVRYVEIIHDRVAEVIADKRHEINRKLRVFWSRVALVTGFILLFGSTYWNQFWTSDKYKADLYPYMEFRDSTTEGTATHYEGNYNNLWSLRTLICDTSSVIISNCPSLETVDASNFKHGTLSIRVHNCDQLKYIILNDDIVSLDLGIGGCPQIQQIQLPRALTSFDLDVTSDLLSFKVHENSRYLWDKGILWDKIRDSILYVRSDADRYRIDVPYRTSKKVYSYRPLTLHVQNQNTDTIELESYSISMGKKYTRRISRDVEVLDFSDDSLTSIPAELFKNMDKLKEIKFPASLRSIYDNAFEGCTELTSIDLSSSSEVTIWRRAFANCSNLRNILFPESVYVLVGGFLGCTSLKELNFKKYAYCEEDAFADCSSLEIINLPNELFWHPLSLRGDLNIKAIDGNSTYWDRAEDGSIISKKGNVILTALVKYHTYEDSIYSSKDGILYREGLKFNEPIDLSVGGTVLVNGILLANNKDNPYSMNLPILHRGYRGFLIHPTNLKELHYPYSNMVDRSFFSSLPDSIRENVTLYVPYGCIKYFISNDTFKDFKEIREESWLAWGSKIFLYHLETGLSIVDYNNFWGLIIAVLIISTLLLSWYVFYSRRKTEGVLSQHARIKIILKSFATIILGPCFWYITYWFIFLSVIPLFHITPKFYSSPWCFIPCGMVAGIIALVAVYMVLYSEGFNVKGLGSELLDVFKTFKQIIANLARHPLKTVKLLCLFLLPILFCYLYVWYKDYKEVYYPRKS